MERKTVKPHWTEAPEPSERVYSVPLLRVKPKQPLTLVFLQANPSGCYLHWDGFRNVPCLEWECPLCKQGRRRDYKLYIPAWLPGSDSMAMLEVPISALKFFQEHVEHAGTCNGFHAEVRRDPNNDKGKVTVRFQRKYSGVTPLPLGPDSREYMERVWSVCPSDPTPKRETGPKSRLSPTPNSDNGPVS